MIRLAVPDIGEQEFDAVKSVLLSGHLVQGKYVEKFETKVAQYVGAKHAIAVSSGTAALHLALVALDIGPGDEVIVPGFTFPATSNVVEAVGATTRLVDIESESYCMDMKLLEGAINERTKAIIPVHEFGHAADMEPLMNLARQYNLKVIEDAACALGTEYGNKKIGTFGDINCFSFHPRKSVTTGEGGVITTNNEDIAKKLRILRNHGIEFIDGKPNFTFAGFNYRLTDFQGALGYMQMDKLESGLQKRKYLAEKYNHAFQSITGLCLPTVRENSSHSFQTYHLLLDDSINRDDLKTKLAADGIETNFGAYAVHLQPYYAKKYDLSPMDFPVSARAFHQGLALPLHANLSEADQEIVIQRLKHHINDM